MKKLILIFSIPIFITTSFSFTCNEDWNSIDNSPKYPICENTPNVIENYLSNITYIINLIPKWEKQKIKNIEWLWNSTLNTVIWAYEISENIFTDFGTNFFANFLILKEEKYIVRDWTKLLWIKNYISKKMLNKIKSININSNIPADNLEKIKNLISNNNSFVLKFYWTSYKELYNYIWSNQQAVEDVFFHLVVKNDDNFDLVKNVKNNWRYDINQEHLNFMINQLKNAYKPWWKTPSCDTTWKQALDKIKYIVCNYWKKKTNEALDRFSCNYKRLRNALFWEHNEANCGSVQLKPFVPLNQRVKIYWINKIMKDARERYEEIKNRLQEYDNQISDTMKTKKLNSNLWVSIEQKPFNIDKNMMLTNLSDISEKIIEEKNTLTKKLSDIEPSRTTHNITLKIVNIAKNLYIIRKNIDGAWDDYEETAAWYMTETCNNQSPYVWKCKKTKKQ